MILVRSIVTILTIVVLAASSCAQAATATFVAPRDITDAEANALSTTGDNDGYLIELNSIFGIVFDQPISGSGGDNISIFTLAPSTGTARATIRFGIYNGGSPQFVSSRNIQAGNSVNVSNLFQRGCGILGGCDYIEILTTRTNRDAEGVEVDYIDVNGEVVTITSPAPEPDIWLLMISGFALVAWRLKKLRYPQKQLSGGSNIALHFSKVGTSLFCKRQQRRKLLI